MKSIKRKSLFAREDLVNRLLSIAKKQGRSLYGLVNEIFELVIRAEDLGVNLQKAFKERWILKKARKDGFILVPEGLWYEITEIAFQNSKDETLKRWFEAGAWLAKRYIEVETEKPFEAFKRSIKAYSWNVPEITIEEDDGQVSVRIISPRMTESYTTLYSVFIQGVLETFGYKISGKSVSTGAIRIKAVRKGQDVKE
ncbi:hypothetical protein DRO64_05825 [Candidatus Bathyarchaeota archaeon]|nr:MAG: hypothetical protein DRO64_05825 [Candidatus Bathyarchaeota archaeon]